MNQEPANCPHCGKPVLLDEDAEPICPYCGEILLDEAPGSD